MAEENFRSEAELRALVDEDPGDGAFVELAELLFERDELDAAQRICMEGLSANPNNDSGRLLLARIFFEKRYLPFAIREVKHLSQNRPGSRALAKLLAALSPGASNDAGDLRVGDLAKAPSVAVDTSESAAPPLSEETVAEAEFDFDDLDLIEDEDEEENKA